VNGEEELAQSRMSESQLCVVFPVRRLDQQAVEEQFPGDRADRAMDPLGTRAARARELVLFPAFGSE